MRKPRLLIRALSLALLWAAAEPAFAAGRVELELFAADRLPPMAQQEWLRRLTPLGVSGLRIRGGRPSDKVEIVVGGTEASPIYKVKGKITSSDELVLPGGKYRSGDVARLKLWLDDLAKLGPPDQRPKRTVFGLTVEQFDRLQKGMTPRVGFSTKGMKRREVIQKIAGRMLVPLGIESDLFASIRDDDLVAEELSDLSCGTALACAVRPLGMCMVPKDAAGGRLQCMITKARLKMEAWPVGWEPEKRRHEILPAMFEFLNVNLQGVTVTQLLDAVGQRLEVPVLLDHNALARHGIEPDTAVVSHPQKRTNYSLMLSRALFQAGLKSEVRIDETGKPFLWITTIKPI
ncbi:MAG: hypothetical protein ACYTG0_32205 [Planctomycetota bacterium]|jgi:hypothetical protein